MNDLRALPSVDQLMQTRQAAELVAVYGRPLTLEAIRTTLDELRQDYKEENTIPLRPGILNLVQARLQDWLKPTLVPVINATGVILHTNLGRAPLSRGAIQALQNLSGSYSTLEYDLESGSRGSRSMHVEKLLTRLTGAEAALVVTNNAAAVLLALAALARRHRVIISRSQLVEIGGGFRVPEVMSQSGAHLIEVGATNQTHIEDYEQALQEPAALVMHAHQSNFKIIGFTSEPSLKELVGLANRFGVPVLDDLGSGALLDTARFGLAHEPTVQESLSAGVDLVCFSGDKLLGGPQAGILAGKADLICKIKKHPLARAVRADKLCLAALSATLLHYIKDEAEREVPVWQMISKTPEQLQAHAHHWVEILQQGTVIAGQSTIGGGSLPQETQPTYLIALQVHQPNQLLKLLRSMKPPIIARIENEQVVFDPRTVLIEQEGAFLVGLQNALGRKI
ncbi:MAG TPA: L-seryl-tRNA(Sec) selenium transferase [Anaerolineaceae bacterium]|nr:L-seryl-tRNA(Sec) selenium transferase [Anaerolineaceae bacterium]